MLDHTLIVYTSDSGESHHPNLDQWPVILIGDLGGRLKACGDAGRLLHYPKYGNTGHRTLNSLYLSLLHAAGTPRDKFGLDDPGLKDIDTSGPLAELST